MSADATSTNRIVVLDENVANRIAAGEVVERPASVVKELVENSLDAGATQITISLEQGGKEVIKVVDNGCGMTREDAVLSLQRHATSKIRSAEDLEAIQTLGFRGEALPSIASVSILEMVTKHESEQSATRLQVEAGNIINLESVGAPSGTTIEVRKLFFNTPARLKFLKSTQTELAHISECVSWFAISYPAVSFRLFHGGREVLCSSGTGVRINALTEVLGKDVTRKLIPVTFSTPVVKIEAFISNPSFTRINRKDQICFVNGRPIRNKSIARAIDRAYQGLIPAKRYPVVVLFLEVAPELVDVNVHPAKSEVRFACEQEVHSAVYRAISSALMSGSAVPSIGQSTDTPHTLTRGRHEIDYSSFEKALLPGRDQFALQDEFNGRVQREFMDAKSFLEALRRRRQQTPDDIPVGEEFERREGVGVPVEESPISEADFAQIPRAVALTGIRIIGQAKNTYIIAECDDGILIIDQHVAHERVLYDRLIRPDPERSPAIQLLVTPMSLSLSARESAIVRQRLDQLRQSGFDVEEFGRDTFILRGVPPSLKPSEAESTLRDIIAELVDLSVARHLIVRPDQVLITVACKMAIKAGKKLSDREMAQLIDDLLNCENPFVCPHGRPIMVSLSSWELDRKFRRR